MNPRTLLVFLLFFIPCAWAEEPVQGILKVNGSVEGATVHVDYVEVGVVPLVTYLSPGRHAVRVAADGFDPFVRRVDIVADSTTAIEAALVEGSGSVEFFVKPSGAAITIDGLGVGTAPIRLSDVAPGTHSWEIIADLHEPATGSFQFDTGQNLLIVTDLDSSAGRVLIASSPEGARVWLDDEAVGVTPLRLADVPPGVHMIRLERRGHGTVLREVDTTPGQRGEVVARLGKRPSKQRFRANIPEVVYTLDGQELGSSRRMVTRLAQGTYVLRVEAPGHRPIEGSIIVPYRGT